MFLLVTKAVPAVLKLVKSFVNYLSGRDFAGTKVYMNYSKKKKKKMKTVLTDPKQKKTTFL